MKKTVTQSLALIFLLFANVILATPIKTSLSNNLQEFSSHLYNSLASPDDAYQKLQDSKKFDQFLEEAKNLALRHGVEEFMGIRLIHRHTIVNNDEIMVEGYETHKEKKCLVTRPQKVTCKAIPSSWIFDGTQYQIFEYSSDAKVQKAFDVIKNMPSFFNKFAELLQKYNYQKLIAISILDRECYQDYEGEYLFFEESYNQPSFASIVTPYKAEDAKSLRGISTGWALTSTPRTHACYIKYGCAWHEVVDKHISYQYHD